MLFVDPVVVAPSSINAEFGTAPPVLVRGTNGLRSENLTHTSNVYAVLICLGVGPEFIDSVSIIAVGTRAYELAVI